jgi:hypothetical protein
MECFVTLVILVGVLLLSLSLGVTVETVLVEGLFKLLPQPTPASEFSSAQPHLVGTVQSR